MSRMTPLSRRELLAGFAAAGGAVGAAVRSVHAQPKVFLDYDQESEEVDRDKRLKRVWEIQRKLEADVARPMLGWRTEYFTRWPYVKNLVPHNSLYNYARMQDVWLDR